MKTKQLEELPVKREGKIRNYRVLADSILKNDGTALKVMAAKIVKEALKLLKGVKDEKELGFIAINAKPKIAIEAAARIADERILHKIALKGGEGVACLAVNRITDSRKLEEILKRRKNDKAREAADVKMERMIEDRIADAFETAAKQKERVCGIRSRMIEME